MNHLSSQASTSANQINEQTQKVSFTKPNKREPENCYEQLTALRRSTDWSKSAMTQHELIAWRMRCEFATAAVPTDGENYGQSFREAEFQSLLWLESLPVSLYE